MIRFPCQNCQKVLSAPEDKAGMRFACPGCKQPVEVPQPQVAANAATEAGAPANASFGKKAADESLNIALATFRQTLKPITYVFEVFRRYRLQKKTADAKLALAQRMYETKLGDPKLRGRIQALGERIHGIQDVKGDAKPAIAERRGLLFQLAEPMVRGDTAPEAIESEHEKAHALNSKLKSQEEALAGALGGMLPPNQTAWRRVIIGYALSFLLLFGVIYTMGFWPFNPVEPVTFASLSQQSKEEEDLEWAKERNSEQIVDKCGPSVALIRFKMGKREGGGTGFMIRPGVIATNAHVIESVLPEELKIFFPSAPDIAKKPFAGQVIYFDRKRDLALLSVDAPVPVLRLAKNFEFKGGRNITIIGCPGVGEMQLENAVNVGVLSTKTEVEKMPYYQLGAPVNPGNSGGPVFDNHGQVIGVVTLKASQESIAFCIPWQDLKERLEALEKEDPHKVAVPAQAMHSLHVIVERLEISSRVYSRVMVGFGLAMQEAARRGRPPLEGVTEARMAVDELLRKVGPFMMDARHQAIAAKLLTDPNIPQDVRDNFGNLWRTYDELKRMVDKPSGTANSYLTRQQQLDHQFDKQFESMRVALGFEKRPDDDDDF